MILSIDIGTTNLKAALINEAGTIADIARAATPMINENGFPCYSASQLEKTLDELVTRLDAKHLSRVRMIVFTGMAEAGLIVDGSTLLPLSSVRPWFDKAALPLYERTKSDARFKNRQKITGLPDSGKYGIYKFLSLLNSGIYDKSKILWMGVVAYMASRITGNAREDISIAARTACVDITARCWDEDFISALGLRLSNFPEIVTQGAKAGSLSYTWHSIPKGVPVCLGGHDHVCAAYSCGALSDGDLFISAGTAQVLMGTSKQYKIGNGLSYGPAPRSDLFTVLGSIQSAGGSVNLFKKLLYGNEPFDILLMEAESAVYPPEMIYYPYLSGSGAPHINSTARASLSGLSDSVTRGDIMIAVYGGIALETRYLMEALGQHGGAIFCMGGLTKHSKYMHALADILGCRIAVPTINEGTLYGAAALALDVNDMQGLPALAKQTEYFPDTAYTARWNELYTKEYVPQMKAIYGEDNTYGI